MLLSFQVWTNSVDTVSTASIGAYIGAVWSGSTLFAILSTSIGHIIWATSHENVSSGIFDQVRFKPACSAAEAS